MRIATAEIEGGINETKSEIVGIEIEIVAPGTAVPETAATEIIAIETVAPETTESETDRMEMVAIETVAVEEDDRTHDR